MTDPPHTLVIETHRLLLRAPHDSDIPPWTEMLTDPETTRYLGPPIDSPEAVAAHIRTALGRHSADGFGPLAIVRKRDGRVIGRSGFLVWDRRTWTPTTRQVAGTHAEIEIGWTLARDCWGHGYASEVAVSCRDYGFNQLDQPRIIAVIQPGNDRSIAVADRLGMQHEQDIRTGSGFAAQIWVTKPPQTVPEDT